MSRSNFMRLAVLASGSGSNFQALVDSHELKEAGVEIVCLFCNVPGARVIERAERAGIPVEVLSHKGFTATPGASDPKQGLWRGLGVQTELVPVHPENAREAFDGAVLEILKKHKPDFLALAGYMRILSPGFVAAYRDAILNIHPALLPSFPGTHGIRDAYDYGVKITGVTVHLVDDGMDTGPIVLQEAVSIGEDEPLDSLEERIHAVEHRLYPRAVALFGRGKIKRHGRCVRILP